MDFLISIPGYILKFCNMLVGNQYLLALFLFAIIVEVVLSPLSVMQQKNSIRQAKLKPKEMAIRKKYAGRDDRQTQQMLSQEIQEMYQKENINPMAGCLPMLIQLPIVIALYNIVLNPLKYICGLSEESINQLLAVVKTFPEYAETLKNATASRTIELMGAAKEIMASGSYGSDVFAGVSGFSEAIPDVSALPELTLFGGAINLAETPSFLPLTWLTLVPILTFVVYFLSMKLTRKLTYQPSMAANDQAAGCSNKMMDLMMPLMSVFIAFGVPAAIGVYWIFKSVIGTLKQFIIHKTMPLPKFTEEDYKAAERELAGKTPKNKEKRAARTDSHAERNERNAYVPKSERVGSVRSLHHIDDEDFEDTKERAERAKAAMAAAEAEKAEKVKAKNAKISLEGAVKKDDSVSPEGKKTAKKREDAAETPVNEVPAEEKDEPVFAETETETSAEIPSAAEENGNETNT